jgi:predicted membrane channel-forming protein YqfA (hemolysin III family)
MLLVPAKKMLLLLKPIEHLKILLLIAASFTTKFKGRNATIRINIALGFIVQLF